MMAAMPHLSILIKKADIALYLALSVTVSRDLIKFSDHNPCCKLSNIAWQST